MGKENAQLLICHHLHIFIIELTMEMKKLYEEKRYFDILKQFEKKNENILKNKEELYYLGLCLFDLGYLQDSINLLNNTISKIEDLDFSRGYCYIGLGKYAFGDYQLATKWLEQSAREKGDFSEEACKWINLLHLSKKSLLTNLVESKCMRFHFIDDFSNRDCSNFINQYINVYPEIKNFFKPKLPKKIDVYIYKDRKDSIGGQLSYAIPSLCAIQVHLGEECGHELTHVISHYIKNGIKNKIAFIDEGLAEHFNKVRYSNQCKKIDHKVDIFDMWSNYDNYNKYHSRSVAKFFLQKLINCGGRNKLIEFIHDQTISNAERIYGDLLYEVKQAVEDDLYNGRLKL